MQSNEMSRRRWLATAAGALTVAPVLLMTREAFAAQNAAMRKALQYQDSPKDGKQCSACVQFMPGKSATDKGQCKAIAGDDEISPNGYCAAFVKKP
ncbi:MAG TPA: high-potential iron-sulfur protein [Burkholderiaceae bacterium]|nr:high-potential iron-sulfur protein [Burkholderiaceae bacterium]